MPDLVWKLSSDGREIEILERDPVTRNLTTKHSLKFTKPKTHEEALKFFRCNFESNLATDVPNPGK